MSQSPFGCHCGSRWGGVKTSHCAGCHRTFSTLAAFDRHRAGSHAQGTRYCVDPASVGLVANVGRGYECWMQPDTRPEPIAVQAS